MDTRDIQRPRPKLRVARPNDPPDGSTTTIQAGAFRGLVRRQGVMASFRAVIGPRLVEPPAGDDPDGERPERQDDDEPGDDVR